MTNQTIRYEVTGGVATITLDRPRTLNAFNDQMIGETTVAFRQAERDDQVRCVVLTGSGRGFSSGQDLADVQSRGEDFSIGEHLRQGYHRLIKQMVGLEKPIVGAINGIAAGAGCGVALACDLRIASEKASLMLAFTRVGLVPDSGTNWFLPRIIGYARAYQLAVTADRLSATEALAWGLVNEVAPADRLMAVVGEWTARLASGPTLAYGLTKRAMSRSWDMNLAEALDYEGHLQEIAARSHDFAEGVQAFLDKREARFKGN